MAEVHTEQHNKYVCVWGGGSLYDITLYTSLSLIDVLPPGPIDNTPLLQVGGANNDLRLVDSASSYRKLSKAAWSYFHDVYGGGPVIATSLDCVRPVLPDTQV